MIEITPIISDNGASVKVKDGRSDQSLLFDCGISSFDELDLPPALDCRVGPIDEDEVTKFHRLEPYFSEGEAVQAFMSHAHYDHMNALRALNGVKTVKNLDLRIWTTNYGLAFVRDKIMNFEDGPVETIVLTPFRTGGVLDPQLTGGLPIQPFLVCHSIPQAHMFLFWTSAGWMVYLSDWTAQRFDEWQAELTWRLFREIGRLKPRVVILGAISSRESTNGLTPLETSILPTLRQTLRDSRERGRRTIITHFGSNVDRTAMELRLAEEMGLVAYLRGAPWSFMKMSNDSGNRLQTSFSLDRIRGNVYSSQIDVLIASGSQAEEEAHLTRAAEGANRYFQVTERDTIFFSARPIPGNEVKIKVMMNRLLAKGAELVLPIELKNDPVFQFDQDGLIRYGVTHVSGHEGWTGTKRALELLKPEIVVPFHGPDSLRRELRDHIETDLPEIEVLMAEEGQTISVD